MLRWILVTKGVGIILVVMGHFFPESSPHYWGVLRSAVYAFHMPLFFCLSGFLFSPTKWSYTQMISVKSRRLLVPFVSVALLFLAIKMLAGALFHLEKSVGVTTVVMLLVDPAQSFMPLLWYVHALFLMMCLYPLLTRVMPSMAVLVLSVAAVSTIPLDFPVIGRAVDNFPYFVVGIIAAERQSAWSDVKPDWRPFFVVFPLFLLAWMLIDGGDGGVHPRVRLVIGAIGVLATVCFGRALDTAAPRLLSDSLAKIGEYSMGIYLFHTLFESGVRIVLARPPWLDLLSFEVVAVLAITSGIVFPLLLEMYVLRRFAVTRRLILGAR